MDGLVDRLIGGVGCVCSRFGAIDCAGVCVGPWWVIRPIDVMMGMPRLPSPPNQFTTPLPRHPTITQLGSTAVGVCTKEGVILAVEKRISSTLLEPTR